MKKILSAVTSMAMGVSVLSSAFVGSFSTYAVSEAPSFAEQSVIKANEAVTANKNASNGSLQWTLSTVKAKATDDVIYVDATVTNAWGSDPSTEGIRGLVAGITYDKTAFELVETGESD